MSDAPKNQSEQIAKLRELIQDIDLCMLTTINEDGTLHSRPMAVNESAEFDGNLWFFTYGDSHKILEIERDHRVNVAFSDPKNQHYVSISGLAKLIRDKAALEEQWHPMLKAWFPDGPETKDIALIKVEAEQAEYWDAPSGSVATAFAFARAVLGHETPKLGDNQKVSL
jgi:general stress protein 26